jgi:hypothetical protein
MQFKILLLLLVAAFGVNAAPCPQRKPELSSSSRGLDVLVKREEETVAQYSARVAVEASAKLIEVNTELARVAKYVADELARVTAEVAQAVILAAMDMSLLAPAKTALALDVVSDYLFSYT